MGGERGHSQEACSPIVSQVVVGSQAETLNTRRDCETLVSP